MKILIVDDNAHIREEIKDHVSRKGDEVRMCADGSEALELYPALQPDWVLMDIRMSTLDGLQTTKRILAKDPTARIAIVTNYANDDQLRQAALGAGARLFFGKDWLDELRAALDEFDSR